MTFSQRINRLFDQEKWREARRLLQEELKREPESHWLLTRLGTTYYEEHDYKNALELTQQAHQLAPNCPLVAWDLAATLEMLDDDRAALRIYQRLFETGVKAIANDECGEGEAWARSLLGDCLYSAAGCLHRLGRHEEALRSIQRYLGFRAIGVKSIYSVKDARARLQEIAGSSKAAFIESEIGELGRRLAKLVG
ncbi:MAG: tetratricopeptide repeat protein [Gemmataceae bacterium]